MHAALTLNIGLSFNLIGEAFSVAALRRTHNLGLPLGRLDPGAFVEVAPRAGVCVAVQHSSRVRRQTDRQSGASLPYCSRTGLYSFKQHDFCLLVFMRL